MCSFWVTSRSAGIEAALVASSAAANVHEIKRMVSSVMECGSVRAGQRGSALGVVGAVGVFGLGEERLDVLVDLTLVAADALVADHALCIEDVDRRPAV